MCKSPLVVSALIALLGSVGTTAAQRSTMYDWNGLSPPEADFMAQQRIGLNYDSHSTSKSTIATKPTGKTSSV